MKTHKHLYSKVYKLENLILAWREARKGKTSKSYVIRFEEDLSSNLEALHNELKRKTYSPAPLKTFILRDPKTRKISKSHFRDRIVHHAIVNIIAPIFDKTFIYDSCANRKGKGNIFALKRFSSFARKVSQNGSSAPINFDDNSVRGYCLKADVKHYFQEVDHNILLKIIGRKIKDDDVMWLIRQILGNCLTEGKGMPLGNLTSQLFANIYLNELDYFVKHTLRAKFYIRYVDDFVILHSSKKQLELWKEQIDEFLKSELKLELHPEKSRIIPLAQGVDFVGFRNFYRFKLLRKRSVRKVYSQIELCKSGELSLDELISSFQGWQAYAKWANTYKLRKEIVKAICALDKEHLTLYVKLNCVKD